MLDVHAPHKSIGGWKEFLLHLLAITIGLLIALSLEGSVEWLHHRHLVHEAEANLRSEIEANTKAVSAAADEIHKQQEILKQDVALLKVIIGGHKLPKDSSMSVKFHITGLDNLSWRTAQSTGALSYMSYDDARDYAQIYDTQETFDAAEKQAARDAIISLSPFMNIGDNDPDLTKEQAASIKENIEILQSQLFLVDSVAGALDRQYQGYLAAHPSKD
jgi:hypothetical protein